jgi:hypothetical protein
MEIHWRMKIIVLVIDRGCMIKQSGRVPNSWNYIVDAIIKKYADPQTQLALDVSVLCIYFCTVILRSLSYELQHSNILLRKNA